MLNKGDKHHTPSVALFASWTGPVIVPSLIVTEVCYLAQNQVGTAAELKFLNAIVAQEFSIEHPCREDWARITELVRQYSAFPLGVADACVITIAERLGVTQLASVDQRHMRAVEPRHCKGFELLPY